MTLLNYKINLNNSSFSSKKNNLILLIRRSPGELDWIIPLLHNLKENYNIFTIFRNENSLNLIKKNKVLCHFWKKTSFAYTIEPIFKCVFWRIFNRLFKKTIFRNYFEKKFQNNYYNIELIKNLIFKKLNKNINNKFHVSAIFAEFLNFSPWIEKFNIKNNDLKTFHFPHTTNIFGIKKIKVRNNKFNLNKYLLLGNSYDFNYWEKKFPNSELMETGYPKYDSYWLKKIVKKNTKKREKIIFVSHSGYIPQKHDYKKYKQQIIDIMDICINVQNYKTIFKIHPTTQKRDLEKILEGYPKKKWKVVDENHIYLSSLSDICISIFSSASILDFLATGKLPIELWNIMKNTTYKSKFETLKLSVKVNNKKELSNLIYSLLIKKIQNKNKKKIIRRFKKNFFTDGSLNSLKKKIYKILN